MFYIVNNTNVNMRVNTKNNIITFNDNYYISYYYKPIESVNNLLVVFLHGYNSSSESSKGLFVQQYCKKNNYSFLTLDYRGHGKSSGSLEDFTVKHWFDDVVNVIKGLKITQKILLVGSSLGGWLSFLYAKYYPKQVYAIVGIAPALDFTKTLREMELTLKPADPSKPHILAVPHSNYDTLVSTTLIKTSEDLYIANKDCIEIDVPIRILHGMQDEVIPYTDSLSVSRKLTSSDVEIHLIKNGTHRLSTCSNLRLLENTLSRLIKKNCI